MKSISQRGSLQNQFVSLEDLNFQALPFNQITYQNLPIKLRQKLDKFLSENSDNLINVKIFYYQLLRICLYSSQEQIVNDIFQKIYEIIDHDDFQISFPHNKHKYFIDISKSQVKRLINKVLKKILKKKKSQQQLSQKILFLMFLKYPYFDKIFMMFFFSLVKLLDQEQQYENQISVEIVYRTLIKYFNLEIVKQGQYIKYVHANLIVDFDLNSQNGNNVYLVSLRNDKINKQITINKQSKQSKQIKQNEKIFQSQFLFQFKSKNNKTFQDITNILLEKDNLNNHLAFKHLMINRQRPQKKVEFACFQKQYHQTQSNKNSTSLLSIDSSLNNLSKIFKINQHIKNNNNEMQYIGNKKNQKVKPLITSLKSNTQKSIYYDERQFLQDQYSYLADETSSITTLKKIDQNIIPFSKNSIVQNSNMTLTSLQINKTLNKKMQLFNKQIGKYGLIQNVTFLTKEKKTTETKKIIKNFKQSRKFKQKMIQIKLQKKASENLNSLKQNQPKIGFHKLKIKRFRSQQPIINKQIIRNRESQHTIKQNFKKQFSISNYAFNQINCSGKHKYRTSNIYSKYGYININISNEYTDSFIMREMNENHKQNIKKIKQVARFERQSIKNSIKWSRIEQI